MAHLLNRYSAVVLLVVLMAAVLLILRKTPHTFTLLLLAVLAGSAILAWSFLRPRQTPRMEEAGQVQASIGRGTPVLLEFQSPY